MAEYLRVAHRVRPALKAALDTKDAVILRVPSLLATRITTVLVPGRPYAVEVVGDPFEVFAPGVVRHPLRPLLRWLGSRDLRRQCKQAIGAAYVTQEVLQRRYPCPGLARGISDVADLMAHATARILSGDTSENKTENGAWNPPKSWELVAVGSLEQLYKGPDVLLKALAICSSRGHDLRLTWLGEGRYRTRMQQECAVLGIERRAQFVGAVLPKEVAEWLHRADLFVLPSRTEGLPRALIEAMASGLPCIASDVGGVRELIPEEDLVAAGDSSALAEKLLEVLGDPARLSRMGQRNSLAAQRFHPEVLANLRREFYLHVRRETLRWQTA